jgi:hypothetical protein
MTNEEVQRIKREVDLRDFARRQYGIESNKGGMAHCPVHPPDKEASLQFWKGNNGLFLYSHFHSPEKIGGTIIDFIMLIENLNTADAFRRAEELFCKKKKKRGADGERVLIYEYKDQLGNLVFRKGKKVNAKGEKLGDWWVQRYEDGKWVNKMGERESIPYNLQERAGKLQAIICEGEKDADTVTKVVKGAGLDYWVTSAMNGKTSWPPTITQYFEGLEEVVFIYDVGAERNAEKHAGVLRAAFPRLTVSVARVPLEQAEADITNYLDQFGGDESNDRKAEALIEIILSADELAGVIDQEPGQREPRRAVEDPNA